MSNRVTWADAASAPAARDAPKRSSAADANDGQVSWGEGPSLVFDDGAYTGVGRDPLSPDTDLHFAASLPAVICVRF